MQDNPKSYCSRAQFAERFHAPLGTGDNLVRTGELESLWAGELARISRETINRFGT
jgi:hypothetical protein